MPQALAAMKTCPACSERGISGHSVLIHLDPPREAARTRVLGTYTRCVECGAAFRFADPQTLEPEPPERVRERVVWIVPPWIPRSLAAEFELSWDDAQRHFRAIAAEDREARPMLGLLEDLRGVGLGSRLRATTSSSTLILTRCATKTPGAADPYVAVRPGGKGAVKVKARVTREVKFGPVPATYGGDLKLVVDALLAAEA